MSRTPSRFTQADIARAIRAIQQTGANMMVEIGLDGVIRIVPVSAKPDTPAPPAEPEEEIVL